VDLGDGFYREADVFYIRNRLQSCFAGLLSLRPEFYEKEAKGPELI
jgi:hypothetical protein